MLKLSSLSPSCLGRLLPNTGPESFLLVSPAGSRGSEPLVGEANPPALPQPVPSLWLSALLPLSPRQRDPGSGRERPRLVSPPAGLLSAPPPTESALFKVTLQVSRMPGKAASGREADGRLTWAAWREHLQLSRGRGPGEVMYNLEPGTWSLGLRSGLRACPGVSLEPLADSGTGFIWPGLWVW